MLTSKQRAHLRSIASTQDDVAIIGKDGIDQNVVESVSKVLTKRELIKIKTLQTCGKTPREYAEDLATQLKAEVVAVIGSKIVLYKRNSKKPVIEI